MASLMRLSDFLDGLAACAPAAMEAELEICAEGLARPVFDLLDGHPAARHCIMFSLWQYSRDTGTRSTAR